MYARAIALLAEEVVGTRRADAVREEDEYQLLLRIYPAASAREACVSPGARAALLSHVRILGALSHLAVKAQTAA